MTVGLVLVSHSSQLAEGAVELARQMAQGKIRLAAAGGGVENVLGTSADKILEAIEAVDSPDGVLLLLDLGSAILSAEVALEMLSDEQRAHTLLSYAPLVEGAIAAAVAAALGQPLREVKQAAEKTADAAQLQQLKPFTQETEPSQPDGAPALSPDITTEVLERQLTLTNPAGLHARPASLFVQTAGRFQAKINVLAHGRQAGAKSIMEVLALGARQGDTLMLRASGDDAQAALEALSQLAQANFYEAPSEPQAPTPSSAADSTTQPVEPQPPATQHGPWQGTMIARGVALGPALLFSANRPALSSVQPQRISEEQVASEQERVRDALHATAQELSALATQLQESIGADEAAIFDAQALMIDDPVLLDATLSAIAEQRIDAAGALATVGEQQAQQLEGLDNELLAARAVDVRDAVGRAIAHLRGQDTSHQTLGTLSQPVILLARDLTPSDTAQLRPEYVLGICTVQGGPTAHSAILARALDIPAITGLNEAILLAIRNGDEVGLDADRGLLYHHPTQEIRAQLTSRLAEWRQQQAALKLTAGQAQAPVILDGRRIHLFANIASEAEAEAARQWGAEGIGLLRTEFLFAAAATLPGEDEQRDRYTRIFRAFQGNNGQQSRPVIVRTLDAGADKPMPALDAVLGSQSEANPALGLRGIRIHLAHPTLLEQQLRALLLAAGDTNTQLHIMFPMITSVEELRSARSVFDRVYQEVRQTRSAVPAHVPVGIMVEVPAAALMAEELAEVADFFSIGANDLLQYTVASDRTNPAVAQLYHPMQPALLRLVQRIAEAGRKAGKLVAVCGEIAGDARLVPILVGLGVDELSMLPTALPAVRNALSRKTAAELSDVVAKVLRARTVAEVEQICRDFSM
jgi:phosphoenolpyruvate-protein phosphotransferase/dihydroxyacetone kinase phosphotransfer subunit